MAKLSGGEGWREREGAVLVTGIARHLLRGTVHSDAAEEEE